MIKSIPQLEWEYVFHIKKEIKDQTNVFCSYNKRNDFNKINFGNKRNNRGERR